MASEIAAIRSGRASRAKRSSHGTSQGRYPGLSETGPSGSAIQPGMSFHNPGLDMGSQDQVDSTPALPKEQPAPMGTRSTSVTGCPCSWR
jgi:hypothetical protein